jgi:SAM-dependent methyltransferase
MQKDRIDQLLDEADRQPFSGWDFGWIEGRITAAPLPWDYTGAITTRARRSPDLLDLGTGGGEWLASLAFRPPLTVATEAWPPNVPVAHSRLASLGARVVRVAPARDNTGRPLDGEGPRLPFASGSLHLVVSRHESFEVIEVARVLAPGGWLITQQVDAGNDVEYQALFGMEPLPVDPRSCWEAWFPAQLADAGFAVIEHASAPFVQTIRDVGALAYGLKAISWMVPGFSIATHRRRLREIQELIDADGPIVVRQRRFFARARKT